MRLRGTAVEPQQGRVFEPDNPHLRSPTTALTNRRARRHNRDERDRPAGPPRIPSIPADHLAREPEANSLMATPMTGPVLPRNDSRSRGRRWIFLGILGAMAVAWAANGEPRARCNSAVSGDRSQVVRPETVNRAASRWKRRGTPAANPGNVRHRAGPVRAGDRRELASRSSRSPRARRPASPETPNIRALRMIDDCQARYETVRDYVCTFSKRERIDGHLPRCT